MRDKKNILLIFSCFLLLILAYAGYTARHILLGPQIALDTPYGVFTTESQILTVTGTTRNTVNLDLNDRQLLLNERGVFGDRVLLSEGINIFIFNAEDKFGRTTKETLRVIYTPEDNDVLQLKNTDIINNKTNNGKEEHRTEEE